MSKRYIGWILSVLAVLLLVSCSDSAGTSQAVTTQVKINEVMSVNSYYAPLPDGSCCDWVEFYNPSQQAVNLKGCMLSDNERRANKWSISTDFVLEAGGYGVIYLSGRDTVDEQGNLHTNFKLSSNGETLLFSNAAGEMVQRLVIPACSLANVSYGREGKSDHYVWFAQPSPDMANTGATADTPEQLEFSESGLQINEYMSNNTYVIYDSNGQYSDWVEIYNSSDADVDLRGYALSDSDSGGKWFFPDGAVIKAGEYMVVFCADTLSSDSKVCHANFKLSGGDILTLYSLTGAIEDSVEVAELNPNVSCGRDPKSGEFRLFASPTPGRANTTYSYELTSMIHADPYSSLYVSEVMCVSNQDGDYQNDFIEIYNSSSKAVSLKGFALSKGIDKDKFTFPDTEIAAGEYRVVYCGGTNDTADSALMAAFKLNQSGEDVYLFDSGEHIIDIFTTGKQTYGHSSGRLEAKKNEVYVFSEPSPGKSNDEGKTYAGYAPMPSLSSEGGYVKAGFQVRLTVPEGTTVRYTTDGSDPNGKSDVYQSPLTVQKTTVIKAAAFKSGYLPSQTVYATFLVEKEHTIPVVSVASAPYGLFSDAKGIMSSFIGRYTGDLEDLQEEELAQMSEEDLKSGLLGLIAGKSNFASDEKRAATFEYFVDGQRAVYLQGGLKVAGEASRTFPQKGFALILGERYGSNECYFPFFGDYSPDKMEALLLRPSGQDWLRAHLRDEFCSRVLRDSTVQCDYQEAQPVALYINGEYWGLYYIREKLNEDYLVNKYGMTKGKIDIIKWEGIVQSGSGKEWTALLDFCASHDLRDEENYQYVCSKVDTASLIDWWVFETYVGNDDTGNIRCYRDRNDGKWHWMLFDLDDSFHLSYYKVNYIKQYAVGNSHGLSECKNTLIRKLLQNEEFRSQFITAYFRHMKTTFAPDRLNEILDGLQAEIEPEMTRQYKRWEKPSSSFYHYNINIIKKIIDAKPDIAKQQVKEAFKLSDEQVQQYYDAA